MNSYIYNIAIYTCNMRLLLRYSVVFYQFFISPIFPPSCKFVPSCSQYAMEVLKNRKISLLRGIFLVICRVGKCYSIKKENNFTLNMPIEYGESKIIQKKNKNNNIFS